MHDLTPAGKIGHWLCQFERALSARDIAATLALFQERCFWRDMVAFTWNINYIGGQEEPNSTTQQVGGYATNDVQVAWSAPWNGKVAVGAMNVGDRYPELVAFDGRPWNFNLYDAYGRTIYLRYTQTF